MLVKQLSAIVQSEFTNFNRGRQLFKTLIQLLLPVKRDAKRPSRFTGNV